MYCWSLLSFAVFILVEMSTGNAVRPPPSLEKPFVNFLRFSLGRLPTKLLGSYSLFLRKLLKYSLHSERKLQIRPFTPDVDILCSSSEHYSSSNDAIIYLHGGAFSLCDSSDLTICDRLISYMGGNEAPIVYSINYDVCYSAGRGSKQMRIMTQVLEAYREIRNSGKRIVCILGDSAGANLALGLMNVLQRLGDAGPSEVGGLCLISPWLDLYSRGASHDRYLTADLIDRNWLESSRNEYVGIQGLEIGLQRSLKTTARALAAYFATVGVQVVAFDMDQCIVAKHSRGRLRRDAILPFTSLITDDFAYLARALHERGIKLAVATHSDAFEYNLPYREKHVHIIGEELAEVVLDASVPELKEHFKLVAYNPRARINLDADDTHKKKHMRIIAEHYGVSTKECVLLDDDDGNVADTDGLFVGYLVDPKEGLRLSSALLNQVVLHPPLCAAVVAASASDAVGLTAEELQTSVTDVVISKLGDHEYAVSRSRTAADILNAAYVGAVEWLATEEEEASRTSSSSPTSGIEMEEPLASSSSSSSSSSAVYSSSNNTPPQQQQRATSSSKCTDFELSCPLYASEDSLRSLPPVLTIAGGKEMFIDDILRFVSRLNKARHPPQAEPQQQGAATAAAEKVGGGKSAEEIMIINSSRAAARKRRRDVGDRLLVAPEEFHAFTILWRHPVHRILAPLGLGWLFNLLFPYRAGVSKTVHENHANLGAGEGYGLWAKRADMSRLLSDEVHSLSADTAVRYIAEFILRIREKR